MEIKNWDEAKIWEESANRDKENYFNEPKWSWDCNFKLDFDGDLVYIESRFYPPMRHYGENWDGSVRVNVLGEKVLEKSFECETLEELRKQVEDFVAHYKSVVKSKFL